MELLGAYIRACGDPDWEIMKTYRAGVRIGVGVDLPRTLEVLKEKVRWRLPEQNPHKVWKLEKESCLGARCRSYSSAQDSAEEVGRVLEDQIDRE